ncbi:hypothetical protein [Porphyromonas endodontalis]|uniref:hypothetical protein n=1 Tax=Porphyromonas endodontalis TaxID=28124 RepID=UPI003F9EE6CE
MPITPELGVWEELTNNAEWFKTALGNRFQDILFNVSEFISTVNEEEPETGNPRKRAKGCYKNLFDKIHQREPNITESIFQEILFKSYVTHKFEIPGFQNEIRRLIMPILNR